MGSRVRMQSMIRKKSQVLVETKMYATCQVHDVLDSIEGRMNEYVIAVRKPKYELLLESKVEVHRQQMNYADGDVFTGIKDVWVAEKSRVQPAA